MNQFAVYFILNDGDVRALTFAANVKYTYFAPALLREVFGREYFTMGPFTLKRSDIAAVWFWFDPSAAG